MPLIAASEEEVKAGRNPIFQSHMWDGSAVPLAENIEIARELLPRMKNINAILEVEIGVVGGEVARLERDRRAGARAAPEEEGAGSVDPQPPRSRRNCSTCCARRANLSVQTRLLSYTYEPPKKEQVAAWAGDHLR